MITILGLEASLHFENIEQINSDPVTENILDETVTMDHYNLVNIKYWSSCFKSSVLYNVNV